MLTKGAASLANFLGEKMAGPLTQEYLDKQFNELGEISSLPFNYDQDTSIKGLMEKYEPNRFKFQHQWVVEIAIIKQTHVKDPTHQLIVLLIMTQLILQHLKEI